MFDKYAEYEFCIAALCHDIGHSAFSHVLETVLLPDGVRSHEDCTRLILKSDNEISSAINDFSDVDAVTNLLDKRHPNKALCDLISSTFDIDRCDYILRDSYMSGVEYGKYDLKWLLHAITVDKNNLGQPVLLLDGPRGLDALRQFLSARRYLHRQVYFHPTVRGAQILLKGIFARIQDIGECADSNRLMPKCLHPLMRGERLSLSDFLRATDVEVLYMVRNFSEEHSDSTLKYLSYLFIERKFPKCAWDSAKTSIPFSEKFRTEGDDDVGQGILMPELLPPTFVTVTKELTNFIADRLVATGAGPMDAAPYLVSYDPVSFSSTPPTDLLFSFRAGVVALEEIDPKCVGFNIHALLDSFTIDRIFVPREFQDDARDYVKGKYDLQ